MSTPAPIENSYWVIEGQLLAGEYPGSLEPGGDNEKIGRLLDAGIRHFVDLTQDGELHPYDEVLRVEARTRAVDITYVRRPIWDMDVPSVEEMRAILDELDAAIEAGRPTYVHCWGGVGRTGTVVGCHFVRRGHSCSDALDEVARRFATMSAWKVLWHREGSPQTPEQRRMVQSWREP